MGLALYRTPQPSLTAIYTVDALWVMGGGAHHAAVALLPGSGGWFVALLLRGRIPRSSANASHPHFGIG